jgi:NTP pyrophosphatase (non-canonical NTP hydrolase)
MIEIQKQAAELEAFIAEKTGKKQDPYAMSTTLSSEVGELCDEVIGLEGDRVEDTKFSDTSGAGKEIVDVIYNALRLANHYKIDLEEHWDNRLKKIKEKFE